MKCKLLLFSILVLCAHFVVSYPYLEEAYKHDAHQTERSNGHGLPQHLHNLNHVSYQYQNNVPRGYQQIPSDKWQRSHGLPHHQQQVNFAKPLNVNNKPQNYYQGAPAPPQVSHAQILAKPQNVYNVPHIHKGITSEAPLNGQKIPQHQIPPQVMSNIPSESWLTSQRSPHLQQHEIHERPQALNNFLHHYPEPYVDQHRKNYGNYDQGGYQQFYQTPPPIIPNPIHNYEQGWPTPNLYHQIPNPSWHHGAMAPRYQFTPPQDSHYNIDSIIHNGFNRPPALEPIVKDTAAPKVDPITIPPEPAYQKNHMGIVPLQKPEKDISKSKIHYILVHANGTYVYVDNLDDILVDEYNVAHIKSVAKEESNDIMAIIEVKDEISETKTEKPVVLSYDTGISKIPQGTDWNTNDQDYPGMHRNDKYPIVLRTELHKQISNLQMTTEETDMKYFKPEYILPIHAPNYYTSVTSSPSTSNASIKETNVHANKYNFGIIHTPQLVTNNRGIDANYFKPEDNMAIHSKSISMTTATPVSAMKPNETNISITEMKNENKTIFFKPYTPQTNVSKWAQNIDDGVDLYSDDLYYVPYLDEGTAPFEHDNQIYFRPGTTVEIMDSPTPTETDGQITGILYGDDDVVNTSNDPTLVSATTSASDTAQHFGNGFASQGEKNYQAEDINRASTDVTTATTSEFDKLKHDSEIDVSDLKYIVDKPVVWFRPDEKFWEKVTKGERGYDQVNLYDVKCVPKLIERHTTVHHYPNGTEVVDYVETIWDHPGDLNPKEVNANRVVRHRNQ